MIIMKHGWTFKLKDKYYFIKSGRTNKSKTIARLFLNYFMKKYEGCGFIPLHIVNNTYNKIYKEMQHASINLSDDTQWYFIHEKHAGATVPKTDLIIIE